MLRSLLTETIRDLRALAEDLHNFSATATCSFDVQSRQLGALQVRLNGLVETSATAISVSQLQEDVAGSLGDVRYLKAAVEGLDATSATTSSVAELQEDLTVALDNIRDLQEQVRAAEGARPSQEDVQALLAMVRSIDEARSTAAISPQVRNAAADGKIRVRSLTPTRPAGAATSAPFTCCSPPRGPSQKPQPTLTAASFVAVNAGTATGAAALAIAVSAQRLQRWRTQRHNTCDFTTARRTESAVLLRRRAQRKPQQQHSAEQQRQR
ncbi:hypothetical protein JKP88DRAFT_266452 [Tribonema minus]|uniref:Uncharacterized protein n=1 Tax=Tribonema minus TaxID=303371 RepID=A0A836CND9_9STRA|nr:hypothetical protein JKP88DRAFT_266452 [Tribonema minus]